MMSGTKKQADAVVKPGAAPLQEAPAMAHVESGAQVVVMQSKLRAEKVEQPLVWDEGAMAG